MEERFRRPISLTERTWLAVDGIGPPYANQIVLEGLGTPDFKELQHVRLVTNGLHGLSVLGKSFAADFYVGRVDPRQQEGRGRQ